MKRKFSQRIHRNPQPCLYNFPKNPPQPVNKIYQSSLLYSCIWALNKKVLKDIRYRLNIRNSGRIPNTGMCMRKHIPSKLMGNPLCCDNWLYPQKFYKNLVKKGSNHRIILRGIPAKYLSNGGAGT